MYHQGKSNLTKTPFPIMETFDTPTQKIAFFSASLGKEMNNYLCQAKLNFDGPLCDVDDLVKINYLLL